MEHFAVTPDALVARLAFEQHGVVTFDQLRGAGLGDGAINLRVRNRRLHRLHRGVFAVGHERISCEGRWQAAVLALGRGALLSHVTAAALWGLRHSNAATVHVTVPTVSGRRRRAGIVVHRSLSLCDVDIAARNGIAVTSVGRTLLDLAAMIQPGPLERAVERSLALRLFDLRAVRTVLECNPRHRGAGALGRVIEQIHDEPRLTRSELEGLMRDLCDASRIARPEVNVMVEGVEVDFFWRVRRLIVETDGREWHGTPIAFERDRERDAAFTMLGYRVVRFTHRRLVRDAGAVAGTLRALLA